MTNSNEDLSSDIVNNLSTLIMRELNVVANEEHFPGTDPDKMDSVISVGRNKAASLRELRNRFENIKAGILI
jgi:hypothetical protein